MLVPQFWQFFRVTIDFQAAVTSHSGQPMTFRVMVDADPVMLASGRLWRSWFCWLGFRCLRWLRLRRCEFRWSGCRVCGYFQNRSACLLGLRRGRCIFLPGNRCLRSFCWNWDHRCRGSFGFWNFSGRCVGVFFGSRREGPICVDCGWNAFGFPLRIENSVGEDGENFCETGLDSVLLHPARVRMTSADITNAFFMLGTSSLLILSHLFCFTKSANSPNLFFSVSPVGYLGGECERGESGRTEASRRQMGRPPPWRNVSFSFICHAPSSAPDTVDNIPALSKYNLRSAWA